MSIVINPISDHELYEVNGKEIYKDSNGNWIAREEFTQQERNAFQNYRKAVIDNKNFKKHAKAEYKG
jgi:phage terminase large subunit